MIKRLYVHNFRCLENFELPIGKLQSALLIGANGSGKSTVGMALEVLQRIGRGVSRASDLVAPVDFNWERPHSPMRLEIEVELDRRLFSYSVAFSRTAGDIRVLEEKFALDGIPIYQREASEVRLSGQAGRASVFNLDEHVVGLWIIQPQPSDDTLRFRLWLDRLLILRPIPKLISGISQKPMLEPSPALGDLGDWFSGVMALEPSAYSRFETYLKQVMPDFSAIKNPIFNAEGSRVLMVSFNNGQRSIELGFNELSDGEKCFVICALVLAMKHAFPATFCFWDEPDSHLSLSEVGLFVTELRRAFQHGGQFIATSHNPEVIRRFSGENTLVLFRNRHLGPVRVRPVSNVMIGGDLIGALTRGIEHELQPA